MGELRPSVVKFFVFRSLTDETSSRTRDGELGILRRCRNHDFIHWGQRRRNMFNRGKWLGVCHIQNRHGRVVPTTEDVPG